MHVLFYISNNINALHHLYPCTFHFTGHTNTLIQGCNTTIIPNSVTSIGSAAFYGCTGLTSITIPNSVTSIGGSAFKGCTGLTSITIPKNVTSIEYFAFDCTGLTSIVWNAKHCNYATSYRGPFDDIRRNITSFTFGNEVDSIPEYLCEYMNKLTSITIPNSVTSIGSGAFYMCTGLTSVTIGKNVTSIGYSAFSGCTGFTSISVLAGTPPSADLALSDVPTDIPIYIPCGTTETYQTTYPWRTFTNYIEKWLYSIEVTTSDNTKGAVRIIKEATSCADNETTFEANASEHYHFVQWNDGNTDNPRTVQVKGDVTTYTAEFAIDQFTISATGEHGRIEGTGRYDYGTTATLTAVADEHYYFTQWSDGNTDNPRMIRAIESDAIYTAEFNPYSYTITVLAGEHGSANGGGTYDYGTTATLTATADEHYHFAQWSDGNTDNPRTLLVEGNTTYTAEFAIDKFTISATGEYGYIDGTGTYNYGTTATLTATADEHYHFTQWTDGNTDNPRTVAVEDNATYTAEFKPNPYTITVYAGEHGNVNGSGTYDYGTTATLTATADEHYHFTQWSDGNTDNPRTVSVVGDATYTAEFKPNSYTITVSASEHGNVSGAGTYDYGTTTILTATANEHYHFTQWSDGNTDNPRTITVEGDATYAAEFAIDQYTITTYAQNGNVNGGGTYDYGITATLAAAADEHYHFTRWSDGNTDNPRTVSVVGDATYTAEFKPNSYTITVSASEHGSANGGGTYNYGTTATLTATADAHYHFIQWSDGNTDNPRTVLIEGDSTYTAEFAIDQHTITVTCDPQQGTVTGGGMYDYGTQVTLTATANSGYEFSKWSNGVTYNPYLFTATEDLTLEAQFVPATAVENISADGDTAVRKVFRNGQVLILRGGKTYTTTGVEVK